MYFYLFFLLRVFKIAARIRLSPTTWGRARALLFKPDAYRLLRFAAGANSGTLNVVNSLYIFIGQELHHSMIHTMNSFNWKDCAIIDHLLKQEP